MGAKAAWIAGGLLAAAAMAGQIPASERIPVTDPDELAALGFARDAKGIFVWSKLAKPQNGRLGRKAAETWGPAVGQTKVAGYELEPIFHSSIFRTLDSAWCEAQSEFDHSARARLHLPDGAELLELQMWAYDDHPVFGVDTQIWEACQAAGLGAPDLTLLGSVESLGAIGTYYAAAPLEGVTVNNRDCAYVFRVNFAPEDSPCLSDSLQFHKLQVLWRRQVSPPPAGASFNDVPTSHMFFQVVEALAKAGVTGGCGNGNFCPDLPLNRGQMAVFLAKALGLQWP